MKARVLKPEEWGRLGPETNPVLSQMLPYVHPADISVVAAENGSGEIAGTVCALRATHFETLWIRPEYRKNPGVFRPMMRELFSIPQRRGERFAIGGADEDNQEMDRICRKLGGTEWKKQRFYFIPVWR